MYQQQQRLQGVADLLANQGRYGDSMLVHMNPIEVQGLASMSPTGSLTVNPETGQPEAFLPFLAPILGGMMGTSLLGGATIGGLALSPAVAGAIGSGLGSWAATGDLKKGLVSGITGFGIGSALGAMGDAATSAAAGAEGAVSEAALAEAAKELPTFAEAFPDAAQNAIEGITPASVMDAFSQVPDMSNVNLISQETLYPPTMGEVFSKEGLTSLTSPTALIPAAVAENYNLELAAEEAAEDWDKASKESSAAELARQEGAILANQFNPNITPAPYDPRPQGYDYGIDYNAGGIISLDPSDFRRRVNGLEEMSRPIVGMQFGGNIPYMNIGAGGYGNLPGAGPGVPAQQQAALRDPHVITPWQLQDTYARQGLPGFGPEIKYFTPSELENPNPWWGERPDPNAPPPPENGGDGKKPLPDTSDKGELLKKYQAGEITLQEYLDAILPNYETPYAGRRAGAGAPAEETVEETVTETSVTPPAGSGLSAEDYADLYDKYMNYGSNFNFGGIGMAGGGNLATDISRALPKGLDDALGIPPQFRGSAGFNPRLSPRQMLKLREAREAGLGELVQQEEVAAALREEEIRKAAALKVAQDLGWTPPPDKPSSMLEEIVVTGTLTDAEREEIKRAEKIMRAQGLSEDSLDFPFSPWKEGYIGEFERAERERIDRYNRDLADAQRRGERLDDLEEVFVEPRRRSPLIEKAGGQIKIPKGMQDGGETQANGEADRLIDLAAMAVSGQMPEEEAAVVIQAFIDEFGEEALLELRAKAAILGELPEEEADAAIQAFIDAFGEEAFLSLRESVLEGVVPGSQKEGEIVGPGGGMDDQVMGMIGNQQPVAVSPGEYIVPADVVSGIGDGSTDAGVQELDGMLDRVRVDRTGTTQQPPPLRGGGVLPR